MHQSQSLWLDHPCQGGNRNVSNRFHSAKQHCNRSYPCNLAFWSLSVHEQHSQKECLPNFIKAKSLDSLAPYSIFQEVVQLLGDIAKSCQILTQNDNSFWTNPLRLCNELKFSKTTLSSFIVA